MKKIIYLDTKFVIGLAEQKEPEYKTLLSIMESKKDSFLIPASSVLLFEISRIGDQGRRLARTKVIDMFSDGRGVTPLIDTLLPEIDTAFKDFLSRNISPYKKHTLCFTRDILGKVDTPLNIPFSELVEIASSGRDIGQEEFENSEWAKTFNQTKLNNNEKKNKNYNDIFKQIVVDFMPIIRKAVYYAITKNGKNINENNLIESFVSSQYFYSVPVLKVLACWHSEKLHADQGDVESNDYEDFQHLYAALSSCDVFATERHLRHIAVESLKFDTLFKTNIINSPKDLIKIIEEL